LSRSADIVKGRAEGAPVALLLIDVINAFDFEGSERIVAAAAEAAPRIRALADRARTAGVPVVYVNDNFGQWRSDFRATVQACTAPDAPGREVSRLLKPKEGDYFVLKPLHSGFFSTVLHLLLEFLESETLVLTGFAANLCVLFTANDAHMRGYRLVVPVDCTAANSPELTENTLAQLRESLDADTPVATAIDFAELAARPAKPRRRPFSR
jgi:nicotinamidase-related amidase